MPGATAPGRSTDDGPGSQAFLFGPIQVSVLHVLLGLCLVVTGFVLGRGTGMGTGSDLNAR